MFPTWKKNVIMESISLFGEIHALCTPVFVDFPGWCHCPRKLRFLVCMCFDTGRGMGLRLYSVVNSFFDCVKLVKQIVLLTHILTLAVKWHCSEKNPTFGLQLAQKALCIDFQNRKNIIYGVL